MSAQMNRTRKRELSNLNRLAWDGQKDIFKTAPSLDSSLKKNTAVIKRLRTSLTSESLPGLLKDLQTISLEKYLPEVISAVSEGLQKTKTSSDIGAAVEVVSALHQRFQKDFTPQLTFALAKGLATPRADVLKGLSNEQKEREEKERMARQRTLLRVGVELWLSGIIRTVQDAVSVEEAGAKASVKVAGVPGITGKDGAKKNEKDPEPFPLEVLKDLLGRDREHVNLPLVVLFAKNFSYDLLGVKPKNTTRKAVDEDGIANGDTTKEAANSASTGTTETNGDSEDASLVPADTQLLFKNVLARYFESVKAHIVRQHKNLQTQSARNAEAYIKSGEIFEDRQSNYEKLVKAQEKFIANAQVVADILGTEMPDLPDEKDEETADSIIRESGSMFAARGEDGGKHGIWQDEDQRRFYEDLIDLKGKVPAVLLEDGKRKRSDTDAKPEDKKIEENGNVAGKETATQNGDASPMTSAAGENGDESTSTAIPNKTIGAQVDALLIRLPELTNRELIDDAAISFCLLNSKASRNRLLKVLEEVPRGRQDLLPYYSRLIATLNRYLPDIGRGIVDYLDKEFRSLQRRKEKDLSEIRSRNIRYLSELTKFGVVPEHVIFHCLKVALEDFHRVNIDVICNILENCGRYLLRNPETHPRMGIFLEKLRNKKDGIQYLGPQERVAIENAFYYVNPPERPAIVQKERSTMELFVRKLIYLDLTKRNYVKILKQLRKLHWGDKATYTMLLKVFTKIWKVRYNNIHILAMMVGGLGRYHQDFSYAVVDEVLEGITVGLEQNNFKHNQRRVAQVKYLGELYNYKLVDSPVIFDALYRIVTFGHEGGLPDPHKVCSLDMPDDFFRIRLICMLLDVCGMCFERGSAKKKLDFFLAFFQYYCFTKDSLPMDIEFIIQDTFSLIRPALKLHTSLQEAGKAFEEAAQMNYSKPAVEGEKAPEAEEEADEGDSSSGDEQDHHGDAEDEDGAMSDGDEEATVATGGATDPSGESSEDEDEEEEIVVMRETAVDVEADAEFDREFAKMMQESLDSRKFDRKPVFDVPLPIKRGGSNLGMLSREATFESENADVTSIVGGGNDGNSPAVGNGGEPRKGKMMFSLLTKKGNKQQTRFVELPSDSGFAVAMMNQKEKEMEEKQRIKELVMSYDRMEETTELDSFEKHAAVNGVQVKYDRGSGRNTQRSRKLSLSDVNWYGSPGQLAHSGIGSFPTSPHEAGERNPTLATNRSDWRKSK